MKFQRSLKNIKAILSKYDLDKLEDGVRWVVTEGDTTQSCYVLREDTIYINPKDIGWHWTFGKSPFAIMFHELGHRFAEKLLTRTILKKKNIVNLFGYYHKKYIRRLRYASKCKRKDLEDFASRYSLVHSADDFCEIFSVCLQYMTKKKNPERFIKDFNKSELCRRKIKKMVKLIKAKKK